MDRDKLRQDFSDFEHKCAYDETMHLTHDYAEYLEAVIFIKELEIERLRKSMSCEKQKNN